MIADIIKAFEGFRMRPSQFDEYEKGGRTKLEALIAPFVNSGHPIEFRMLGYPMKSTNHRDKTIGVLPDMAEEVSFTNFRRFGEVMKAVYPPGVHLTILSDGYVFNDILGEPDSVVDAYGREARDMSQGSPVTLLDLRDFFAGKSIEEARSKVVTEFGISGVELEQRVLFDPNVNALYRGMIKFMEEELANREFASKRKHHLAAKALAKEMMFRNEAYSGFADHELNQTIRLSMHPSTNNGKYSFQLIASPRAWTSPWHCALLIDKDGIATIHKSDAEAAGHQLITAHGRPYFYHAND